MHRCGTETGGVANTGKPYYYCTFCKGNHRASSAIGKAHDVFRLVWPTKDGRKVTYS